MTSTYTYNFLGLVGDADNIIATLGRKYLPVPVDEETLYDNYLREMPYKKITVRTPIPFKRFKVQVAKLCSNSAVDSVCLAKDWVEPDPRIYCVVCRVECDSMINGCGSTEPDTPDYCNKCCGCKDCWVERHDCACFFGKEGGQLLCEFCDECAECGDHSGNCEWERERQHCVTCKVLIFDESRRGDRGCEDNRRCFDSYDSCMRCCPCEYCEEFKVKYPLFRRS